MQKYMPKHSRELVKTSPIAMAIMKTVMLLCILITAALLLLTSYLFWMDLKGEGLLSSGVALQFTGATLYFGLIAFVLHKLIKRNKLKNELIL